MKRKTPFLILVITLLSSCFGPSDNTLSTSPTNEVNQEPTSNNTDPTFDDTNSISSETTNSPSDSSSGSTVENHPPGIFFLDERIGVVKGKTNQVIYEDYGLDSPIVWNSSNESVATVDKNGLISALKKPYQEYDDDLAPIDHTAIISAKSGCYEASILVTTYYDEREKIDTFTTVSDLYYARPLVNGVTKAGYFIPNEQPHFTMYNLKEGQKFCLVFRYILSSSTINNFDVSFGTYETDFSINILENAFSSFDNKALF